MKVKKKLAAILATLGLGAVVAMGGCATLGMDQAAKTTSKIETVQGDMKEALVQVDATNASLETMMKPDQMDMKKAYDDYASNVSKMEKVANKLDKHDEQMQAQGKAYFKEWEKKGETYTDPQLRDASQERRTELTDMFNKIPEASSGMKESLHSYMAEIKQIQKYMANDMTRQGVEAMTPSAQKAITTGENLKNEVRPVLTAMDRAMSEMAHGTKGTAAGGTE